MDRKKFEEMQALEKFTGPARPVLRAAKIDLQTQLNMERHRANSLERKLLACYLAYPHLHYARDILFNVYPDGTITYKDPKVQTVEPPF